MVLFIHAIKNSFIVNHLKWSREDNNIRSPNAQYLFSNEITWQCRGLRYVHFVCVFVQQRVLADPNLCNLHIFKSIWKILYLCKCDDELEFLVAACNVLMPLLNPHLLRTHLSSLWYRNDKIIQCLCDTIPVNTLRDMVISLKLQSHFEVLIITK